MMKKLIVCFVALSMLTGCVWRIKVGSGAAFRSEYQGLNGSTDKDGNKYREIRITDFNPFILSTPEKILKKMEKGETFYAYYGDPMCPWCRSVIESVVKSAEENGIKTIYSVRIWNDDHNEIFRDVYGVHNGEVVKKQDGTETYYKTLERIGDLAGEYNLKDENGTVYSTGEKRIFAPNFIFVKDGQVKALCDGISKLQKDPRGELTDEIKEEQITEFNTFFAVK